MFFSKRERFYSTMYISPVYLDFIKTLLNCVFGNALIKITFD